MFKYKIKSSQFVQSNDISCTCGHCGNVVSLDVYAEYYTNSNCGIIHYFTGQCPHCGKPIIYDNFNKSSLPYVSIFEKVKFLPEDVEILYNECTKAFSVESYTCCVISARTLMANIAVEQGAEEGKSFVEYVNYLQTNCLPTKTNNAWVDKIRQLGNNSTHKLKIATKEDAELSLKFIIAILKNVYEFPNCM